MIKNLLIAACIAGAMTFSAGAQQVALQAGTVELQAVVMYIS